MKARPKGGARASATAFQNTNPSLPFFGHTKRNSILFLSVRGRSRSRSGNAYLQIRRDKIKVSSQMQKRGEPLNVSSQASVVFVPSPVTHPAPPLDAHVERLRSAPRSVRDVSSHPPEFDNVSLAAAAAAGFRARDGDPATDE